MSSFMISYIYFNLWSNTICYPDVWTIYVHRPHFSSFQGYTLNNNPNNTILYVGAAESFFFKWIKNVGLNSEFKYIKFFQFFIIEFWINIIEKFFKKKKHNIQNNFQCMKSNAGWMVYCLRYEWNLSLKINLLLLLLLIIIKYITLFALDCTIPVIS